MHEEVVAPARKNTLSTSGSCGDLGREVADVSAGVRLQPDGDHRLQRTAEHRRIDVGVIAADHARSRNARTRPRQVDGAMPTRSASALFGIRASRGELGQDAPVDLVESAPANIRSDWRRPATNR